jgi:ABC-2 type transport system ATP-binding protein
LVILSEPPALHISGLTKVYENGFQALNNISLDVSPGDFFALLGPNGAGKSTTIGILCSLIRKTSGKVEVFGKNIDKHFSEAKKDIGIVPQELNFNQFEKILDIVVTQAGYYGLPRKLSLERAEIYLRKLGLWEKRHDQARMLSGGMKRRLMIARALIHEPRLLILDEPTAGVDIELRRSLWDFLREINQRGTTIILTTHYLEEAENLCRNIAIIDRGEIVENTTTRKLLSQLNKEVFIFDTQETLTEFPAIKGYPGQLLDKNCFEVLVEKNQSLNELFSGLSSRGINIISMRNKSNRLEELFISMVKANNDVAAAK